MKYREKLSKIEGVVCGQSLSPLGSEHAVFVAIASIHEPADDHPDEKLAPGDAWEEDHLDNARHSTR